MIRSNLIEKTYLFLTVITVFVLSLILSPYFINGDQTHYYRVYNGLNGFGLYDGFIFYKANIDSREPGYFLLAWASSNLGIDKIYFVTFFNIVLAYFGYRYLIKLGGHPLIIFIIVSFSYYSHVLFFSAERLKFGFIFLLMGFIYSKKSKFFYALSVITHSQIIIVFASTIFLGIKNDIFKLFTKFKVNKKFLTFIVGFSITSIIFFIIMQEHLLSKFNSYFEIRNIIELSKLFSFSILAIFYAKNKSNVVMFFIPLFFFTLIFGGDRVNFIGYFAFLYFSLHYRKGFNIGVILTTIYFLYASLNFDLNIINYGNGYYGS